MDFGRSGDRAAAESFLGRRWRAACLTLAIATCAALSASAQTFVWSGPGGNGHTYTLIAQPLTYVQARTQATALGGYLVEINDAAEQAFVFSSFWPLQGVNAWIGLTDEVTEGTFRWDRSGALATYVNWVSGEPNNDPNNGGEDYVEMKLAAVTAWPGQWNDQGSATTNYAIVEIHPSCATTARYTTYGVNGNDQYGTTGLVWLGDINGDTIPDYAVGARRFDTGGMTDNGRVVVYSGGTGSPLATLYGSTSCDLFGQTLAAADLDGDGIQDLIVGSPRSEVCSPNGNGKVAAYSGAALGAGNISMIFQMAGLTNTDFGFQIVPVNLIGGAPPELVISSPRAQKIEIYQMVGSTPVLTSPVITGGAEYFGFSVAMADVDADSVPDIVVGAIDRFVAVYSGATRSLLWGRNEGSGNGYYTVAGLGDLNGDGHEEFAVTDPIKNSYAGEVVVFSGATFAPIALPITGQFTNAQLGASGAVLSVGDLDHDGSPDFVVGEAFACGACGGSPAGRVYVYSGAIHPTGFALLNTIDGAAMLGVGANSNVGFGITVAAGADIDGDGRQDLLVGAHKYDSARGAAVVVTNILGSCPPPPNLAPTANAGPDLAVDEGQPVMLDGRGSSDPESMALAYTWIQVSGPMVSLSPNPAGTADFTAPFVSIGGATLTFELTVSDGTLTSAADTVNVIVRNVNHPPVANAGDPQSVPEYSVVTLDGSRSFDPDDDALTFGWLQTGGPTVTLSDLIAAQPMFVAPCVSVAGATLTFTLYVYDAQAFASDTVEVRVENVNHAPVVDAGQDELVNEGTAAALAGQASDPDGDVLTYSWVQLSGPPVTLSDSSALAPSFSAPVLLSGSVQLVFELTVTDGIDPRTDQVVVLVRDNDAAPDCSLARASQDLLWPPNHGMIPILIQNVHDDAEGDHAQITVTSVTQDEPTNGLGDGDTAVDAVIRQDGQVLIRAERSGTGNGRVYVIHFTATDHLGQQCSGWVRVTVPHSNKKDSPAIDDGQSFVSTQ